MDLEPVGATSVAGSPLRHAHVVALPQAARLAGGAVLLVDDALALVLALADGADVVVRAAKEGLQWRREGRMWLSYVVCNSLAKEEQKFIQELKANGTTI